MYGKASPGQSASVRMGLVRPGRLARLCQSVAQMNLAARSFRRRGAERGGRGRGGRLANLDQSIVVAASLVCFKYRIVPEMFFSALADRASTTFSQLFRNFSYNFPAFCNFSSNFFATFPGGCCAHVFLRCPIATGLHTGCFCWWPIETSQPVCLRPPFGGNGANYGSTFFSARVVRQSAQPGKVS